MNQINVKLDEINENLNAFDRMLNREIQRVSWLPQKIIKGLRYYVLSLTTRNHHIGGNAPIIKSESYIILGPYIDIEVLFKSPKFYAEPCRLRLGKNVFGLVHNAQESLLNGMQWSYQDLIKLEIRDKPLTAYIVHKGGQLNIISSYLQLIVNELVRRSLLVHNHINVIFQKDATKFDYGDARLSLAPVNYFNNADREKYADMGGDAIKTYVSPVNAKQDKPAASRLDTTDDQLNEITTILTAVQNIATKVGEILDEQTDKLVSMSEKVNVFDSRIQKTQQKGNKV
eukprot:TRINITY_DN5102_c0_g1_i1.p1 TRINITY_DN5102_c0_g1~~TRINITY_DN5102_c0_g1_i1.p1  ORF type:complete len:286 (+),score=32.46 TRINITY_DN5102_c0_g1_i1:69-926(+)